MLVAKVLTKPGKLIFEKSEPVSALRSIECELPWTAPARYPIVSVAKTTSVYPLTKLLLITRQDGTCEKALVTDRIVTTAPQKNFRINYPFLYCENTK